MTTAIPLTDRLVLSDGARLTLVGWVTARRVHKHVLFWDLRTIHMDDIQVVIDYETEGGSLDELKKLKLESSVRVTGTVQPGRKQGEFEFLAGRVEVISEATRTMTPGLRDMGFDILRAGIDHTLTHRDLYLRHPKLAAAMRFRALAMQQMRHWFDREGIIEFTAPVLTPIPLYADHTAMSFQLPKSAGSQDPIFLTQCVGYYLEAAAHAVGAVYNMGPSFRGERSKSNRHLMEYWHVKAELPEGDREFIIDLCERLVSHTIEACREEGEKVTQILGTTYAVMEGAPPYERISYPDAIKYLQNQGFQIEFGDGISGDGEEVIGQQFNGPFWIVGNSRQVEPFPYVIDPDDPRLTLTADLICPKGYGELLGTAEKIYDMDMLDERMREKGKAGDPRYDWIRDMRKFGMVPHTAFGMGLERFLRWLIGVDHVRDTMPFPRVFHRPVHP